MTCNKGLIWTVILLSVFCVSAHANMLTNGSFETSSPTGWTPGFTSVTTVYYSGPAPSGSGPTYGTGWGANGGWGTMGSSSQAVDVTAYVGNSYVFSAWLSSWTADTDYAEVTLEFFDASSSSLDRVLFDGNSGTSSYIVGSANSSGQADSSVAWTQDNWTLYEVSGIVPTGAVQVVVTLSSKSVSSNGNDGYIDLVNLDITAGPSVIVTETDGGTSVTEAGSADTYTLSLSEQPSVDVTVTATPADEQIDLGAGPGNAVAVVFTSGPTGNWATPKTISVTAVDDDVYEGKAAHETLITHTATGGDYQGSSISTVLVGVFDNEQTCGDWGYFKTDLNRDCHVNLLDFAIFASYWTGSMD